jgi:hypothetical protein
VVFRVERRSREARPEWIVTTETYMVFELSGVGGTPAAKRGPSRLYVAGRSDRANEADGPFSTACEGRL